MENLDKVSGKRWLEQVVESFEGNNFEVFLVENMIDARKIFFENIFPALSITTASWGDSITLRTSGILEELRCLPEIEFIDPFDPELPREILLERRREALFSDLFLTGSNALTKQGQLVNLDMVGNRVSGITFGPRYVTILAGRNKIVPDVTAAMNRIRSYAAPENAFRHSDFKTPCRKTGYCMDCKSPQRICNTWCITEKAYPKGRIKLIIINENYGL